MAITYERKKRNDLDNYKRKKSKVFHVFWMCKNDISQNMV